ncbi:hypothetical protein [Tychonema sp. LEGE 07203]|uniref:hypothetical protein n=1 Tax=Tychonema sp. LEGE 07203 TaxID=1828671 RepID=UPI001881E3A6|nr:hypothetical protein [Tychonema sp. LEGE 07203]MBE9096192.1 hypothetical protein [Tychonema sp. LEGE 07203]
MKQHLGLSLVLQSIFFLPPPLPARAEAVGCWRCRFTRWNHRKRLGCDRLRSIDRKIEISGLVGDRAIGSIGRDASCPIPELLLIYQT